jgi:hypothetical protein
MKFRISFGRFGNLLRRLVDVALDRLNLARRRSPGNQAIDSGICLESLLGIDAGCHSFCLSGCLHDEEAERFGRLVRPILAASNRGRLAA